MNDRIHHTRCEFSLGRYVRNAFYYVRAGDCRLPRDEFPQGRLREAFGDVSCMCYVGPPFSQKSLLVDGSCAFGACRSAEFIVNAVGCCGLLDRCRRGVNGEHSWGLVGGENDPRARPGS